MDFITKMNFEKLYEGDFAELMEDNTEDVCLDFLQKNSFTDEEIKSCLLWAAFLNRSKIVKQYISSFLSDKNFMNQLLVWSFNISSYSNTENFYFILDKIDATLIDLVNTYADYSLVYEIFNHDDYKKMLEALCKKSNRPLSNEELLEIIKTIKECNRDLQLDSFFFIAQNKFFEHLNSDLRDDLLKQIFIYLQI